MTAPRNWPSTSGAPVWPSIVSPRGRQVRHHLRHRWLAAALLMVALAAGCVGSREDDRAAAPAATGGTGEEEGADLRFAVFIANEAQLEVLNGIADDYARERPGATVTYESIPAEEYLTKVLLQTAGGNAPDLALLLERNAANFRDSGVLADVAPALRDDAEYGLDDFPDGTLEPWQHEEGLYGVPFSTSPFFVMYNEDLFTEAGVPTPRELFEDGRWNWESLRGLAAELQPALPQGTYAFVNTDGTLYDQQPHLSLEQIIRAYGGESWSEAGDCTLDEPEAVEAITLYHGMIFEDGSAVPPGVEVAFPAGQAAMTLGQLSRLSQLEDADFAWDVVPLPEGPVGQADVFGQAGVVVLAGGNVEAATDYLRFMTNEENTALLAQYWPPAREAVLQSPAFAENTPALDAERLEDVVVTPGQNAQPMPLAPAYEEIRAQMVSAFDELWTEDADVAEVLATTCEAVQPLLTP